MASEETGEPVAVDVPDDLRTWLQTVADDRGLTVEAYVRELLAAQRVVETGDVEAVDDVVVDPVTRDEFEERLDAVETGHRDLLEDVRDRVVQVKRETDGKAPVDHDHEDLRGDLAGLDDGLADLVDEVDDLQSTLDDHSEALHQVRTNVDDGFDNFEAILEYLVEATDDLSERVDRLARATLEGRERVRDLAGAARERERADGLKRDAALEGITSADCGECGHGVRIALLTAPECPYCGAGFADIEPKQGFLGSPTLTTGVGPALVGGDDAVTEDAVTEDIQSDLEADRPDPSDVDWDTAGGED